MSKKKKGPAKAKTNGATTNGVKEANGTTNAAEEVAAAPRKKSGSVKDIHILLLTNLENAAATLATMQPSKLIIREATTGIEALNVPTELKAKYVEVLTAHAVARGFGLAKTGTRKPVVGDIRDVKIQTVKDKEGKTLHQYIRVPVVPWESLTDESKVRVSYNEKGFEAVAI